MVYGLWFRVQGLGLRVWGLLHGDGPITVRPTIEAKETYYRGKREL